MEIVKYLKALNRRKLLLIIVPVITVIITFFLVRNLPDQYTSNSRISTGLTDPSQQVPGNDSKQESSVMQEFSNIMQVLLQKQTLDQVSYQIIIHDLTNPKPFREPSKLMAALTPAQRQQLAAEFGKLHAAHAPLLPSDQQKTTMLELLASMKYDNSSLLKNLSVYRVQNSDFIEISVTSESSSLSAFVANTAATEFITNYGDIVKTNRAKTKDLLTRVMEEKLATWQSKLEDLKNYKIKNNILKLDEQAKTLYGQIADYETRRQNVEKEILGTSASLQAINAKFQAKDRRYLEATTTRINADIVDTKELLRRANDEYITAGFDDAYLPRVDSLKKVLERQINESTDRVIYNPLSAKTQLVTEKLTLETQLEMARNSVVSVARELNRLSTKLQTLVPHEAVIQNYETGIDMASKEYLDILNKWNAFSMEGESASKLKQVEVALPGVVQPSKKMLLIILSGVISFTFCVVVILALAFFDRAVGEEQELADKTGIPVLGDIDFAQGLNLDLKKIWHNQDNSQVAMKLKSQLRALRFEVNTEMKDSKVLAITSLNTEEGKTFTSINLAYAYAVANKKVLLIDGNFGNPAISQTVKPPYFVEDVFTGKIAVSTLDQEMAVLGNRGGDQSLMELATQSQLAEKIKDLTRIFDIIIIDTAAMEKNHKAKEWINCAERTIAIFEKDNQLDADAMQLVDYLKTGDQLIGWVFNKA